MRAPLPNKIEMFQASHVASYICTRYLTIDGAKILKLKLLDFLYSWSYSNFSMFPRCRIHQGFKILAGFSGDFRSLLRQFKMFVKIVSTLAYSMDLNPRYGLHWQYWIPTVAYTVEAIQRLRRRFKLRTLHASYLCKRDILLKTMYNINSWFHCLLNHNLIFRIFQHFFFYYLSFILQWGIMEKFD